MGKGFTSKWYVNVRSSWGTKYHVFKYKKTAKQFAARMRKFSYVKSATVHKMV